MTESRKRLGEIFVEKGLITEMTLQRALVRAKRLNKKLGIVLEDIEVITGEELGGGTRVALKGLISHDQSDFSAAGMALQ